MASSERLTYRRFFQGDVSLVFALDNDPNVMRYINGGLPVSKETVETELLPRFIEVNDIDPFGFWLIEVFNEAIGWCSLRRHGKRESAELGYRLIATAWGQGYATEACRWLVAAGFADEALALVYATTYEDNTASISVLEKLGFTLTERFRLADAQSLSDTSVSSGELWDGDDLRFELTREKQGAAL